MWFITIFSFYFKTIKITRRAVDAYEIGDPVKNVPVSSGRVFRCNALENDRFAEQLFRHRRYGTRAPRVDLFETWNLSIQIHKIIYCFISEHAFRNRVSVFSDKRRPSVWLNNQFTEKKLNYGFVFYFTINYSFISTFCSYSYVETSLKNKIKKTRTSIYTLQIHRYRLFNDLETDFYSNKLWYVVWISKSWLQMRIYFRIHFTEPILF